MAPLTLPPEPGHHIDLSDVYADLTPASYAPVRRVPGPAERAMFAAIEDHARRWVQACRDTLAELGCTDAPCRDRGPELRMERTPLSLRGTL